MIQRQQKMMDRCLVISVLVTYILIGQGEGKVCPTSRARLNPTLYIDTTCPAECCSDLSFKFCCEVPDDLNEIVVIVFCVVVGVISIAVIVIICCCYEYQKKKKKTVSEEEEESEESYHAGPSGEHYGYSPRAPSGYHGYPSSRGYASHTVRY